MLRMNVVPLADEPNETAIEILERWLKLAKDLRITDVAVAAVVAGDESVTYTLSKDANINMLLAATTALQHEVLEQHRLQCKAWVD